MFKNTLLLSVSSFICIVFAEVALRVVGYSAPIFRMVDADLGWRLAPNIEGLNHLEQKNYVQINSTGFHDREHNLERAVPGKRRIAIIGDSFTQATEVPRDLHFGAHLEQLTDSEVLRFGVVGYGTAQAYLMIKNIVLDYKPDVVMLVFYLGNDVSDNHYALAESLKDSRPYFTASENGVIPVSGYPKASQLESDRLTINAVNALRFIQLLKEVSLRRHSWVEAPPTEQKVGRLDDVFLPPAQTDLPEAWQEAWSRTEGLLVAIDVLLKEHSVKFVVVGAGHPMMVHPSAEAETRFTETLGVADLAYPETRIEKFLSAKGITYYGLSTPLKQRARTEQRYFHGFPDIGMGFGHWNEEGHRAVAELLATELLPNL